MKKYFCCTYTQQNQNMKDAFEYICIFLCFRASLLLCLGSPWWAFFDCQGYVSSIRKLCTVHSPDLALGSQRQAILWQWSACVKHTEIMHSPQPRSCPGIALCTDCSTVLQLVLCTCKQEQQLFSWPIQIFLSAYRSFCQPTNLSVSLAVAALVSLSVRGMRQTSGHHGNSTP